MQTMSRVVDSQTVCQQGFECEESWMDLRKVLAGQQIPVGQLSCSAAQAEAGQGHLQA